MGAFPATADLPLDSRKKLSPVDPQLLDENRVGRGEFAGRNHDDFMLGEIGRRGEGAFGDRDVSNVLLMTPRPRE